MICIVNFTLEFAIHREFTLIFIAELLLKMQFIAELFLNLKWSILINCLFIADFGLYFSIYSTAVLRNEEHPVCTSGCSTASAPNPGLLINMSQDCQYPDPPFGPSGWGSRNVQLLYGSGSESSISTKGYGSVSRLTASGSNPIKEGEKR